MHHRSFSHDIMLTMLELGIFSELSGVRILLLPNYIDVQNNEMLVCRKNPVEIELFSLVKNFFLFRDICIGSDHVSENNS